MEARALISVLAVLLMSGCEAPVEEAPATIPAEVGSPLQGVWRILEGESTDTAAARSIDPPSVYIFTDSYYSIMRVIGGQPRQRFAAATATDAEKLTAYDTFIANSGSYEVTGDMITMRPLVAKNPSFMDGGSDRFQYRTAGDTLWLIDPPTDLTYIIGGQPVQVPQAGTVTLKLLRVEG
jgi:hypothetical protein